MPDRYRDRPPFPPDDDYRDQRYPPEAESDPLAELARLIGQTDPFSNFGREHTAQPQHGDARDQQDYADDNYGQGYDPRGYDTQGGYDTGGYDTRGYDQHAGQGGYAQSGHAQGSYDHQGYGQPAYQPAAHEPAAYDTPAYDDPQPGPPSWMRHAKPAAPLNGRSYDDGLNDLRAERDPAPYARGGYDPQPQFDDPRFDQPQDPHGRYDDVLYGEHPAQRRDPRYDSDQRYDQRGYETDDYAEEPPVRPRRGGTMTVFVVLALAVLGTAGAYAYRSFVGSPRSGEPPIIRADAGPNKIIPPSQSDGKQITDRVGDRTGERMVSREEQPVDVNGQPNGPRVVFPPLSQNTSPPTTSAVSPDQRPTGPGIGNGTVSGDEPRKIRTLTIRPDGTTDTASVASSSPASAAAPPARTIPLAGTRNAPPAAASAPMALTPQTDQTAPSAAPAPRARVASVNPSTSAPVAGGSYVQVSSQKSEADALASYKVLQGKYGAILGSRSPVVRRADLGDKGVYYRAMVGPFGTTEEATQFCLNLQSAGGKCIVQRN
ncbi:MAG: SPOR domain-containing protein [Bradyrhizobiaceae bacterium]|nr:MAG: SPOR domain-containing protein [Bradyrhizobiaceae bacterium]